MAWWKQIGIVLALVVAAVLVWASTVPTAVPVLARLGLDLSEAAPGAEARGPAGPGGGPPGAGPAGREAVVIARAVVEAPANGRLTAIGDGRAIRSVAVTPLVAGRVVEVAVFPGDRVAAGDVLALLDDDAEAIQHARAELAVADAETTLERVQRLQRTGSATDVQLREAELALERARLELRDAALALERRRIVAPFDGVVGILPVEPGMQVTTSSEIATIDDRSRLLVDFRVPERWVGALGVGDRLQATALARPELVLEGAIHAVDNRIDEATRTLRVQAVIDNEGDALRAGMAFRITMDFEGEHYPAVDPLAIQWSSEGAYVWAVRADRAERVPVRIIQRSSEQVLVAGALEPGEPVVTEGVQRLRPGALVRVRSPEAVPPSGDGAGLDLSRAGAPASDT